MLPGATPSAVGVENSMSCIMRLCGDLRSASVSRAARRSVYGVLRVARARGGVGGDARPCWVPPPDAGRSTHAGFAQAGPGAISGQACCGRDAARSVRSARAAGRVLPGCAEVGAGRATRRRSRPRTRLARQAAVTGGSRKASPGPKWGTWPDWGAGPENRGKSEQEASRSRRSGQIPR